MTTFTELLELFIDAREQFNRCQGRSERVQAELLDRYDAAIRRKENQMKPVCARSSEKSSATAIVRLFAASLAILVIFSLASTTALALTPCGTLAGSISTWSPVGNGNWSNSGQWLGGVPNSATDSACIADGSSTVALDISANIDDLQLASGNTLNFNGGTSLTVNGTQIINAGAINVRSEESR